MNKAQTFVHAQHCQVELVTRLRKNDVGEDPDGSLLSLAEQLLAGQTTTDAGSSDGEEAEADTVDELTDFESDEEGEAEQQVATADALLPFKRPAVEPPSPATLLVGCCVVVRWPSNLEWEYDQNERWFRRSELISYHTEGGPHLLELQQQVL